MFYFVGDIEKTKVTDFKTASSPQEVVSYLSSGERLKKTTHLYHYTKLSSMIGIIKSGYWIMRSPKDMNDIFEFENWSQYDWGGVFFASFMGEQKENIGMWSMYAQPWVDGVKIAIDKNTFKNWIKNIKTVYKADPETYDWSTFLTVFLMLILGILSRVGLSVLIVNLTNRLAANDKWVFPTDGLHAFYKENPEKSVDDGICHILEEEQVSGKYWRKYRGNADIRKMVDDIRKPIYNEYKEAEAAKERARLAEKMKNWEQEAAKYTKYANRKGKEKSIQYCKDRIAYYNKVLGNYSPENMSKARGEMMDLSNKIYKSTAQREHDWALHGGIAEGIAGTAAGVATALNIQRENAQIRSQNAALGKRIGDMNVAYMQALDEQKTILNGCLRRWKENLKTAQETTIKQEDQKKLMEILAPKVSSVFVENELHVLEVWIKADCTSYNISKSLSKIGYGSLIQFCTGFEGVASKFRYQFFLSLVQSCCCLRSSTIFTNHSTILGSV